MTEQRASMQPGPTYGAARTVPWWVWILALLGIAAGGLAFGIAAAQPNPAPAWQALLVNFLFWYSLAQGALAWSVVFRLARVHWSPAVNRLGHAMLWYLPFCLIILGLLYIGHPYYLTWEHVNLGYRHVWLNVPFVLVRDWVCLFILVVLSWLFVRTYLRVDRVDSGQPPPKNWRGEAEEAARANRRLSSLGVFVAYAYGLFLTLIGFDLVMSLTPIWHSTLFGWYFTVVSAYSGIAALAVMAVALRGWLGVRELIRKRERRYVGNLMLAFAMLTTYFFYSQALVIWYENLPPEIVYVIPRIHLMPWQPVSWVIVFTTYLGVFCALVIMEIKEIPATLCGVGLFALAAIWVERYAEVAPSITTYTPLSPALVIVMGLGFLGVLVITTGLFLVRYPAASRLDEVLVAEREQWQ